MAEPLRVAILGCGGMAGGHARRYLANPDAEIVALCDLTEELVEGFRKKHMPDLKPQPELYTDPATMFAEAKLDAVSIVTPHTLHFEHGMLAVEAGCHVLMEKPMVTDSGQAVRLAQAVEETGVVFVIGYNTPCTPPFQYLRQQVRKERFGRLEVISGWLAQNWKRGTAGAWRQNPKLSGGGQMYDSGAHLFNSLVWTVEQPVAEVHALIDNLGTPVDINGTVNVRFANDILATIAISGNCSNGGAGMVFCFEDGRVEIDGWGGGWIKVFEKGQGQVEDLELPGKAQAPMDNFIDAIRGRAAPATTPLNGVIQSQLMDAIYTSAHRGEVVRLSE